MLHEHSFKDKIDDTDETLESEDPSVIVKDEPQPDLATIAEEEDEATLTEEAQDENLMEDNATTSDGVSNVSLRDQLNGFLDKLPSLVSRDLIDQAAVDFVTHLNNKASRNKLLMKLYSIPRTRIDLLPFYARLVASLQPVHNIHIYIIFI